MRTRNNKYQHAFLAVATLCIGLYASNATSSGFQLNPTTGAVSRSLAGAGVTGSGIEDIFYNPAALNLYSERTCSASFLYLNVQNQFVDSGSSIQIPATGVSLPSSGTDQPSDDDGFPFNLACGFDAGNMKLGFTFGPKFGLTSTYDKTWIGRYHAINSELITLNLSPSIGYEASEHWLFGAGLDFQYAEATLGQGVFLGPGAPDGFAELSGDDTNIGFNLGAIYNADRYRLGVSLYSKMSHELEGDSTISGTGVFDGKTGATAPIDLPESVYLSGEFDLSDQARLLGTARWTKWSRFSEIRASFEDGRPDSVTPQNWDDTWTYGLALEYDINSKWTGIASIGYDESPVTSAEFRSPRIPDTDRNIFGLGALFTPSGSDWTFEFAYHRTSAGDRDIDNTIALPGGAIDNLNGYYADNDIDVFSFSLQKKLN